MAAGRHASAHVRADRVAVARQHFLTSEPVRSDDVRPPILASWGRSREHQVAADRVQLPYVQDPRLDTPLTRAALPVLARLCEHLAGQPISVILTDASGVVLSRLTADHDLERHLDRVQLAPGFSYAESSVGTNGIGTALADGRAAHVFGHEHYAEDLEDLACAGVPVRDPTTGRVLGAVDLTCWRRDADSLLVALARSTADQVTRALLDAGGGRETRLLQAYLRTCRRAGGVVLAFNGDVTMVNEAARQALSPGDEALLLARGAEMLASRRSRLQALTLSSGAQARLHLRPVDEDDSSAGAVLRVELSAPGTAGARPDAPPRVTMPLPGVVGSGPLWLRACKRLEASYAAGERLVVQGEPGVGKLAVLRAVHRRRDPAGRFCVLDAPARGDLGWARQAHQELADGRGTVVVRHADRLDDQQLRALTSVLQEQDATPARRRPRVALTLNVSPAARPELANLLSYFPVTVEIPPLRHHLEDLHALVPFFLQRLGQPGRLGISAEVMQVLVRAQWPGNVEQLWQVLRQVVQRRRSGSIEPGDLPPECWTRSRRLLSPLESIERDAIVQSLLDCGGNKLQAARSLGMSRATIYRKIREFGIVTPCE